MSNNQTKNVLLSFGTPNKVQINGKEIPSEFINDAIKIFDVVPQSIKALRVSQINGILKVKVETYTAKDYKSHFANKYNVDVAKYCTRNSCMDCKYFNHEYMVEINRNCPLFKLKKAVLEIDTAQLFLDALFNKIDIKKQQSLKLGGGNDRT